MSYGLFVLAAMVITVGAIAIAHAVNNRDDLL